MRLLPRRIIFIIFSAVFVAMAILIVLYAMGWRYNYQNKSFNKVGALYISTTPSDSNIFLDDTLLPIKTPNTVNDLLPNVYTVRLGLAGYYDWETTIRLYPSALVRLSDVFLIKKTDAPQKILNGSFGRIFSLPNNRAVTFDGTNMLILRLENDQVIFQHSFDQLPGDIISYPSANYFIVKRTDNRYYFINPDTGKITDINEQFGISPLWVAWSTTVNNAIVYADAQKTFTLKLDGQPEVLSPTTTLFANGTVTVANHDNSIVITKNTAVINTASGPKLIDPFAKEITSGIVYITSPSSSSGMLYSIRDNQFIRWDHQLTSATASTDGPFLFIVNPTELWQLDMKQETEKLLNRTSVKILSSDWILNRQFVYRLDADGRIQLFGLNDNSLNVYELSLPGATDSVLFEANHKIIVATKNGLFSMTY